MEKLYICKSKDEDMIKTISIENYKSVLKLNLELGRINVFIGANGSGKSNILEAIAMVSAQEETGKVNIETLIGKGVRVAKPTLTVSSFLGKVLASSIKFQVKIEEKDKIVPYSYSFCSTNADDIYSEWSEKSNLSGQSATKKLELFGEYIQRLEQTIEEMQMRSMEKAKEQLVVLKDLYSQYNDKYTKNITDNLLLASNILGSYLIFSPNISALRGLSNESKKTPLGINGEGLDVLFSSFSEEQKKELLLDCHIDWLDAVLIDNKEEYKNLGYKLGRSISNLFFVDKYMQKKNNVFSAENANEGALFILFYLALFISDKTPAFFAIDNVECGLNPRLCRYLMKTLAELSKKNNKQALITTHNPAILDGLNLHNDEQRLFVVSRNDEGQTKVERIKLKPQGQENIKLSDLWISGQLGGIPEMF